MIHKGISVSQDESSYRDFLDKIRLVYMLYVKNIVKIFLSAANSDSTMRRIDETHPGSPVHVETSKSMIVRTWQPRAHVATRW